MNRNVCLFLAALCIGVSAEAATSYAAPDIMAVSDSNYGGSLEHLSDNGLWAVGYGKSQTSDVDYSFPRLLNISTGEITYLFSQSDASNIASMTACDVTNDGSVVVGSYDGLPAVWRSSTGTWEIVENNHEYKTGVIERVTPDGKLAIGTLKYNDGMFATMRVWDLSGATVKDITPDNLPKPIGPNLSSDRGTYDPMVQQLYAGDLSFDGAYFTGMVNFSYPGDCWTFIYDMNAKSWRGIAMNVEEDGDYYNFSRSHDGVFYANPGSFVGNSHNITGELYSNEDEAGIFFYDADADQFDVVADANGYQSAISDPLGTIYASKSYEGPMRYWFFKTGDYWYDFAVLAQQLWGIDWDAKYSQDGLGLTGTFTGVSDDGLTLMASDYSASPYVTYIIKLPAPLPDIVKDFNMLGNYYATPVSNSSFAYLREVKVTFDRYIDVVGEYSDVRLLDENGEIVATSVALTRDASDSRSMSAVFRNQRLEEGKSYTAVFPAGVAHVSGDPALVNEEIKISYKGRPDAPVSPISISPVSGSEVSRINANSNPITIRFNAELTSAFAWSDIDFYTPPYLYLVNEDGSLEEIIDLECSISGDILSLYPLLEQRLAYGSNYQVVIPGNLVTDLSGADPNEKIVLNYVGSYLPDAPNVDGILFEDNFDAGLTNKWMFYDGASDQEPSDLMASWGFSAGLPWWVVRETDASTEQSAATHSMFKTPAQADSWMVTSILNISDESAYMTFNSQSYRDAGDVLKVIVYPTDDIYTSLTKSIVNNFRYYGDVVYEEVQYPGESEELLAGEWKENNISLANYAGKNIYVAFVNENRNKSAIFLDDVKIAMDVKFALLNLTPESVVAKTEIDVEGQLQVISETDSFKGYSIALLDADGNLIAEVADPDTEVAGGWKLDFKMPQSLPLNVGKVNKYQLLVKVGEESQTIAASVSDLAIETSKKVVIEEYTGQACQYCPLGHIAIDYIQNDFPELVLPIELHSYPGDSFSNDKVVSLTSSLGMSAAPTGRVNRLEGVLSPMDTDSDGTYIYKNAGLWYDYVVSELENLAPADIEVTSVVYDGSYCIADVEVTYALDLENANLNLLLELCEDDLMGFQTNGVARDQEVLGEWGANGIYNRTTNLYYYKNVLRNWEGTTFNGTGGLLPSSIQAGVTYKVQMKVAAPQSVSDIYKTHVTAMLIDSESGKILNADRRSTENPDAVDAIDSALYSLVLDGTELSVSYPGHLQVNVFSANGQKLASASGSDSLSIDPAGYSGVAIVMVRTADGIRHHKIYLK